MFEEHLSFLCPSDETKIWRYMDMAKFLSLLECRSLYFCRCDMFEDPYEYAIPMASRELWKEYVAWLTAERKRLIHPAVDSQARQHIIEDIDQAASKEMDFLDRVRSQERRSIFVNCWHMNTHESQAMWRLYASSDEGIAIQATVGDLKRSLAAYDRPIHLGAVNYIDHAVDSIDPHNAFNFILHKYVSFKHEQELRAAVRFPGIDGTTAPHGISIPVDLNILMERVYIAPSKQEWFADLVRKILGRYEVDAEFAPSTLLDPPA